MTNFGYSNLIGRLAVVTGAAGGIGAATCLALSKVGAKVIAVDRDETGLAELRDQNGSIETLVADVSDPDLPRQLDALLARLEEDIHILVNNAGIGKAHHALETSDEEMARFIDINFMSVFRLSRWAVGRIIARGASGSILNVSSVFGLIGAQNSAAYASSKAAIVGLTQQMAADFGPSNIRVNAIAPGLIETPLTRDRIQSEPWRTRLMVDQSSIRRVGLPLDVAKAIRFLVSDEASFITGLTMPVDGGWINGRYPRETPINLSD